MELNEHEIGTSLWHKLQEWQVSRLERYRRELEQDKDELTTAKLRGRIDELKVFLRAGEPSREIVVDAE